MPKMDKKIKLGVYFSCSGKEYVGTVVDASPILEKKTTLRLLLEFLRCNCISYTFRGNKLNVS